MQKRPVNLRASLRRDEVLLPHASLSPVFLSTNKYIRMARMKIYSSIQSLKVSQNIIYVCIFKSIVVCDCNGFSSWFQNLI